MLTSKCAVGGKQINARLNSVRRVLDYMALSSGSETIMLSTSRISDLGTIIRQFPTNMVRIYRNIVTNYVLIIASVNVEDFSKVFHSYSYLT